ncbi:endonuclease/exonuclease/phosphatase family [Colletotrichum truncatum]|uniref:Endonuclease/exonuclease/phosphatase family n=1 Tax=Colletotrichum truncatum TaxID=5467 RepID=A0ACC3Z262_COLTU|nr:endonuclease/exonuclease/phosphatase family [Colletotrichum truncatum]KAF6781671.1 endonuclease/exonuclease/phosphatase family [Colletotrichum truncatum]
MRLPSLPTLLSGILFALEATTAQAAPATRQASGSLAFLPQQPLLTFKYSTSSANAKNWVGVYHASGGGPDKEEFVEQSLAWAYAPQGEGTVKISATDLLPGDYKAFFLANDGYKWLSEPVIFQVPFANRPVAFIVNEITLPNARQGDKYEAKISGLRIDGGSSTVKYSKVQGDDWVKVSADGTISGTPNVSKTSKATVEITASDGSSARLQATVPVRASGTSLVGNLAVMTYNLWHGGTQVNGYHAKQVRFLASSGADVVGVQESTGGHAQRLGDALGWYSWQGSDVGIISKYPITTTHVHDSWGGYVEIALGEDKVVLWNVHLGYTPYGPYDFCFDKMSVDKVLKREEESKRTPQIKSVVKAMQTQLANADKVPVLLVGDFNAPSHMDWTDALKDKHCGQGYVPWPTSIEPTNAGLVDSFRVAHPDPKKELGITWSPIFLTNEGRPEPMDRIDFVYHKGKKLAVADSKHLVVGSPKPEPNHADNEWTSDHAAVLTNYLFSK